MSVRNQPYSPREELFILLCWVQWFNSESKFSRQISAQTASCDLPWWSFLLSFLPINKLTQCHLPCVVTFVLNWRSRAREYLIQPLQLGWYDVRNTASDASETIEASYSKLNLVFQLHRDSSWGLSLLRTVWVKHYITKFSIYSQSLHDLGKGKFCMYPARRYSLQRLYEVVHTQGPEALYLSNPFLILC